MVKKLISTLLLIQFASGLYAQKLQMQKTKILLLVDASHSMVENWESRTKIDALRMELGNFIDKCSDYGEIEFAMRLYGQESESAEKNCTDSKLVIPFSPQNGNKVKVKLNQTNPKGLSSVAYAMEQTINDFENEDFHKKIIILFADGADACNGSICSQYNSIKASEKVDQVYCIGLSMPDETKIRFQCIENFANVTTEHSLRNEFNKLFSKVKPY